MDPFRRDCRRFMKHWLALCLTVGLALIGQGVLANESALYERPTLVIDPGMHTALIRRADVDASGRFAVTGSQDKTVRVWSMADGRLLNTIRVPAGPSNVGKIYAVAISPNGKLIAAGGWTRINPNDEQEQIYLFDRESGSLVRRIAGLPNVVLYLGILPRWRDACGDALGRQWHSHLRPGSEMGFDCLGS